MALRVFGVFLIFSEHLLWLPVSVDTSLHWNGIYIDMTWVEWGCSNIDLDLELLCLTERMLRSHWHAVLMFFSHSSKHIDLDLHSSMPNTQ